ncbi:phage/plasmid primase, P4 family protein [Pectobacterium atrosepticum ICMP 1526]|nr:phage/plasmid primase, P4 family protein [Pectobacterium atrosepticum ICMP 1526]
MTHALLQIQQNSNEALEIKRSADPLVDFCGYLLSASATNALYIGILLTRASTSITLTFRV